MFELFTEAARGVVVRAQEWTRQWGLPEIGTGGMLAALADEASQEAGAALARMGVTSRLVQERMQGRAGERRHESSGHIPFSARFKATLSRAADLATAASDRDETRGEQPDAGRFAVASGEVDLPDYPGPAAARPSVPRRRETLRPGHLLLALLDDPDCTAVTMLADLGVDLDGLRASARELLDSQPWEPDKPGAAASAWTPPTGRHRPAGTSRFPPPDASTASPGPFAEDERRGWAGGPGLPGSAAAGAAWAALQRRQAGLPLWALRLWRGDMAIHDSEAHAAQRLLARLPLRPADRKALLVRHLNAVREIVGAVFEEEAAAPDNGRRDSVTLRAAGALSGMPRRAVTWAMRRWRRPPRGWVTWLGKRWSGALARCLGVMRRH